MVNVLLLGCDGNAGMNYAKCLKMGDENVRIIGTGHNKYHLKAAEQSGLFEVVLNFTDITGAKEYNEVRKIVKEWDINFVHAQPEEEVAFLCDYGDNDIYGEIPCHGKSYLAVEFFKDKTKVQKLTGQEAYLLDYVNPTFNIWKDDYWLRANNGAGSRYALPVQSWEEAIRWYEYLESRSKVESMADLSIARYLPGREFAVQMFFINGSIYHMQQRERVEHHFARQMISGQSSTPSVAKIENRADVYQEALDIVLNAHDEIGFEPNGIYGVDLRCNENDEPKVTEVNYGRYFTTSDFFATHGVNTPYDELRYATLGIAPEVKLGAIKDEIYWVRGLDHAPISYTKDELDGTFG